MKHYIHVVVAMILMASVNVYAEEEQETFNSLRCGMCHKTDSGSTMPSLKDIAAAYKGKEDQLLSYFKGEAEPLVNPEKSGAMKTFIEKTKQLEDEERKALADFILGH